MFDSLDLIKTALKKAQAIQPNAAASCVLAEVIAVDDPLEKGRCKVRLDNFTAADGSIAYSTDWCQTITTSISNGRLPKSLVGKKVLAFPINQSYESVVVNVNNSLVYTESDVLPKASVENLGIKIIRIVGSEAFTTTCLLRNNTYAWVDCCDLKHGHATGDTQDQDNDTGGDFQTSIEQLPIHDSVFSTAVNPYVPDSGFLPPILT
jgi:hypothetical protein